MTFRPALRDELVRISSEDGTAAPVALFDPIIGRRINLGVIGRSLVPLLDGQRTVAEVLAQAQHANPARHPDEIEAALRSMFLLLCLQGTDGDVIARARAIRFEGLPLEPTCLDETRVQCQGSGACCHIYSFGPLTPEDLTRLSWLDIPGKLPEAGPGPYVEQLDQPPVTPGTYLKNVDGHCVFLLPNRLCGIHARFGESAKPGVCRLYPLRALPTIRGNRVHDRGECSSFVPSALEGRLVRDELPTLKRLLPTTYLFHPVALLDARTACDYSYVLALADRLVEITAHVSDVAAALQTAADVTERWSRAIRLSPLEPGAADVASAAELAREATDDEIQAGDFAALAQVAGALVQAAGPEAEMRAAEVPDRLSTHLAHAFVEAVATVRSTASRFASGVRQTTGPSADAPWVEDALRRSLRQRLFGELLLDESRLHAGLAAASLVLLIAVTAARKRAESQRREQVVPEDLSFGHAIAARGVRERKVIDVLTAHDAEGCAIARAAGALLDRKHRAASA